MIQNLKLIEIHPSKTNPRKHFDETTLQQLADNIKEHGVLEPILVRLKNDGDPDPLYYEIVAGERRYRAAKLAGKEDIPAIQRKLSDVQVLEIQVIENMQRADLHPLEEAQGYKNLILTKQYDVAKIAGAVSRPHRYVYDRLRLLELIPQAQKLFVEGTIQTGHAVLLSRLTKEQQEQAIDTSEIGTYRTGGLFQAEIVKDLFDPDTDGEEKMPPVKLRSVREFEDYINEHVRMEPSQPDIPELLPATAAVLDAAQVEAEKVVLITRLNFVPEEARVGDKIAFPRSWRRADGIGDSNDPQSYEWKGYKTATCEYSVMGFVAVGPGRGEAFLVCTAKKKCKTHWADAMKESAARGKLTAHANADKPDAAANTRQAEKLKKEAAEHKERMERFHAAAPAIEAALIAAIKKEPIKPGSIIWKIAEDIAYPNFDRAAKHLGKINTADGFLRALALEQVLDGAIMYDEAESDCEQLGINFGKLLDEHAPVEKPKAEKKTAPAKKKPKKAKRT
jgi:ParB family chromosome partitioning protein